MTNQLFVAVITPDPYSPRRPKSDPKAEDRFYREYGTDRLAPLKKLWRRLRGKDVDHVAGKNGAEPGKSVGEKAQTSEPAPLPDIGSGRSVDGSKTEHAWRMAHAGQSAQKVKDQIRRSAAIAKTTVSDAAAAVRSNRI